MQSPGKKIQRLKHHFRDFAKREMMKAKEKQGSKSIHSIRKT